jgi:hypothetical protein
MNRVSFQREIPSAIKLPWLPLCALATGAPSSDEALVVSKISIYSALED